MHSNLKLLSFKTVSLKNKHTQPDLHRKLVNYFHLYNSTNTKYTQHLVSNSRT